MEWLTREPLRLAPNRVYRIYTGGAMLDRLRGKPDPVDTHFPEEWVVNTEYVFGDMRRTEDQCFMGLGFELGMRCFNFEARGMEYVRRHMLSPEVIHEDGHGREEILIGPQDTPCFGAGRVIVHGGLADKDRGRCYIGIVAEGQGHLMGPEAALPLRPGMTLFVPAASRHHGYEARPEAPLVVIKCFPPPS